MVERGRGYNRSGVGYAPVVIYVLIILRRKEEEIQHEMAHTQKCPTNYMVFRCNK